MSIRKVVLVDYGMGNHWSVISALKYIGINCEVTNEHNKILKSDFIILPGVGAFNKGMVNLVTLGLDKAIRLAVENDNSRILGICLGMQLLGSYSTEMGVTQGLSLIPNNVEAFSNEQIGDKKIPHVGFNTIKPSHKDGIFSGLPEFPDFYFTHSYRMMKYKEMSKYATCNYGADFLAAFECNNICGAQFHPEKSQTNGLIFLKNFFRI